MRMKISTINRLVARRLRGERGSSLVSVVGIAAVTAIVGVTVGTLTVHALNYTSANRASVQARAAAEAGITAAVAGLQITDDCAAKSATYSSGTEPVFNATIQYKTSGDWIAGCPTSAATGVRIESTGLASTDPDAAQHTIEAIYSWIPTTTTTTTTAGTITESGSAAYSYGASSGMTINDVIITSEVSGRTADFVIKNGGNKTCQSGTRIEGNVIIQNGSLELNACVIVGNLAVSGYAAVNSGGAEVTGNVSAAGNTKYSNQYSAIVGAGAKVGGNITGNGPMRIAGAVKGNVGVAGLLNLLSLTTITPEARIDGNVTTAGSIDSWNQPCGGLWILSNLLCGLLRDGVVKGVINVLNLSTPSPAVPSVPDWSTYTYNQTDWTNLGFSPVTWQGSCTVDNNPANQVFIKQVMASTVPLVVDARSCGTVLFSKSAGLNLRLNANVAFIGNAFTLEDTLIDASVAAQLKAWFIVPGAAPALPVVCANAKVAINNNTRVTAKVAVMVFTPGCIENSSTEWRGQFYAGSVNLHVDTILRFVPVGMPGVNLDNNTSTTTTGGTTTVTVPGGMGSLISMRDLAG